MNRFLSLAIGAACTASLAGCVSLGPTVSQVAAAKSLDAIMSLKAGVSTLADVESAYSGEHCLDVDHASQQAQLKNDFASQNCAVIGMGGKPPITALIYVEHSSWSPSCWSDPDGCEDLTQETTFTTTYTFGAGGVLKSESAKTECTAYVNEYIFKNGCIDHD